MKLRDWGILDAATVSSWLNFNGNSDWCYNDKDRESMAAKQTEGVAYLWNLLSEKRLALLADEVGMGKTFQALGVAALLWKMRPDARVLIMAPNRDICYHWRREFDTLIRNHYRETDHNVKNSIDGGPVPSVQLCFGLKDLAAAVERGAGHLYLTTIHSLSGLVPNNEKDEVNLQKQAKKYAGRLHKRIKNALDGQGFDLVIVDEAHYLRNRSGGSQRVAAAEAFFGDETSRIAQRSLMLTATPSHSSLADVENVLSYFQSMPYATDQENANNVDRAAHLLREYGLRRLRLMEGVEGLYCKEHYRHELPAPSNFEGRPDAELFFAFYQKRLIADLQRKSESRSLVYGYLEGFESVGIKPSVTIENQKNVIDENDEVSDRKDFNRAFDTELLKILSKEYSDTLGVLPQHPKYDAIVEQCMPTELIEAGREPSDFKHLIFVRRIPSVRELTQRFNVAYDELLAEMLLDAWNLTENDKVAREWKASGYPREMVEKLARPDEHDRELVGAELDATEPDQDDDYLGSRIAGLFVTKKDGSGQTDCERVRLRFTRPDRVYSLFLEPSQDYLEAPYTHYQSHNDKSDYANSARYQRFKDWSSQSDLTEAVGDRPAPDKPYDRPMPTAWSLMVPHLKSQHQSLYDKLQSWASANKAVAENFSNYLQVGTLYASPVMVELYSWFVRFRTEHPGQADQGHYHRFVQWIEPKLPDSLMFRYFVAGLETFDALCGKVSDHGLDQWQKPWSSLRRMTHPAWYASGDNAASRQSILLGFNSPFYPNVVVSTSVFQEGVNLHLNCHQVHHYGLAGSPGDNEQRVGRVDRLFGCVNRRLKAPHQSGLSIHYPFLANSVDQDQVASFILRKHQVEGQLDACLQTQSDNRIHLTSVDWERFLRTPKSRGQSDIVDPYPALLDQVRARGYHPQPTHREDELISHIENCIQKAIDPDREQYTRDDRVHRGVRTLFLVTPRVEAGFSWRHQPIYVNKVFTPEISALLSGTAYHLNLISPLANKQDLHEYCKVNLNGLANIVTLAQKLNEHYPLVQLRINEEAANSYFYLSAVVNLPVFVQESELSLLSSDEMKMALTDLKQFSDELERAIFNNQRDLIAEHINHSVPFVSQTSYQQGNNQPRSARKSFKWRTITAAHGEVSLLEYRFKNVSSEQIGKRLLGERSIADPNCMLLTLNQKFPYVRFEIIDGHLQMCLPFPTGDLQPKEKSYLEAWFNYLLSLATD